MIFKNTWQKVLDGTKTQTRRPVRECNHIRYELGKSYAVQPGRGMKSLGRIEIMGICWQPLQNISKKSAIKEGFKSVKQFREVWDLMYSGTSYDWDHNPLVAILTFKLETDNPT
jgi:hypothetical protein